MMLERAKFLSAKEKKKNAAAETASASPKFPPFILYFIAASVITTIAVSLGVFSSFFSPVKELIKFLIVVAMAAIGLNTNIIKLVKSRGKPILMGACCWLGITGTSLLVMRFTGLW